MVVWLVAISNFVSFPNFSFVPTIGGLDCHSVTLICWKRFQVFGFDTPDSLLNLDGFVV